MLPLAGDILPGLPAAEKARLFHAFDLEVLWNKPGRQATVHVEITDATLRAVPGILDPSQDGYHDTDPGHPAPIEDLFSTPIAGSMLHRVGRPNPARAAAWCQSGIRCG